MFTQGPWSSGTVGLQMDFLSFFFSSSTPLALGGGGNYCTVDHVFCTEIN